MPTSEKMEALLHRVVDAVAGVRARPVPTSEQLAACRIVSHRGEHDNRRVFENSLAAFEAAAQAGVWGIECDVRWTRDRQAVVFHDHDLKRLFNDPRAIRELTLAELERGFPVIPSLADVVARFGGRSHLMIEVKSAEGVAPPLWSATLRGMLASLEPVRDYHLMSLVPERFDLLGWAPPSVFLPIGRLNLRSLSRMALARGWGGVTGHYLLLSGPMAAAHRRRGQQVGTGFPSGRNVLFREILRGVDWIFSNRAVFLQGICNRWGSDARP